MTGMSIARRLAVLAGALAALAIAPAAASAAPAYVCGSSDGPPATLRGEIKGPVVVEGTCLVNSGQAKVRGSLTVEPGGALIANFAGNAVNPSGSNSRLIVFGPLVVKSGGVAIVGCEPQFFTCNGTENPGAISRSG